MKKGRKSIDISENMLRKSGDLLDILLKDRTTKKRIIWATDSYEKYGDQFFAYKRITPSLVTEKYGKLIQPRAVKSLKEQRRRTREKAEVFTPLHIVKEMNKSVDKKVTKENWKEYVRELKLEITCGEGPFIASRYDPTRSSKETLPLEDRVGFLDSKLRVVSKYCDTHKEWFSWAKEAFKASYGYDWQGDNVLLTRENLLYTFIDFYEAKFGRLPTLKMKKEIAKIVSWNIFQMDGLTFVVPMSCHNEDKVIPAVLTLFEEIPEKVEKHQCKGCCLKDNKKHNGIYVKIKDWQKNKTLKFVDLFH